MIHLILFGAVTIVFLLASLFVWGMEKLFSD